MLPLRRVFIPQNRLLSGVSCEASSKTRNVGKQQIPTIRFRDLSAGEFLHLTGPLLVVLAVGLALRVFYPSDWWPQDVAPLLADALIVAGLIGLALKRFATRFLIRRVADELAEKLVGRGLPSELQAHIKKIVETDLVKVLH